MIYDKIYKEKYLLKKGVYNMRGPEEKKYFYGMLGTVLICVFVYVALMYFQVYTFVSKEYCKNAENISMQFGNNFEKQLICVEECVSIFSNKYGNGLDGVKLFDAISALIASDSNISYVIFKNDSVIYDNIPANSDLRKEIIEIEERHDEKYGNWLLSEADRSLIYAVRNEDDSVIVVLTRIDPMSKKSLNSRYLKNAGVYLSDGTNIVTLKEKAKLSGFGHETEFKYKFGNGNLKFNYRVPVPDVSSGMIWLGMASLIFTIVFAVYILVINKYVKGIFSAVTDLEEEMQKYLDSKK